MPYHLLPKKILSLVYYNYDDFMIFETNKFDRENYLSYIFIKPYKTIIVNDINKIKILFKQLDYYLERNFYVAGFFSYELGYCLDFNRSTKFSKHTDCPYAFFNIYKQVTVFNHNTGRFIKNNVLENKNNKTLKDKNTSFDIYNLELNTNYPEYAKNVNKIKKYIVAGDTYQVNYTIKYKFNFVGNELTFYNQLKKNQQVEYSCIIKNKHFSILSFSPELFFRRKNNLIIVQPMKGTIVRNKNKKDIEQRKFLFNSLKNRSENLMIVDLLRNDLGKISKTGSVKLENMFYIKKYKTLFQMVSTIKSKLKKNINTFKLFNAIFPSGSVIGAPKIRTMEIIREIEPEPRGVYTGALGFFKSRNEAVFNVAIRTIFIKNNNAELGIGSAIVFDSNTKNEFQECKLKSNFFNKNNKFKKFNLIETVLWDKNILDDQVSQNGFFLLKYHLQRLQKSAEYFNFQFDKSLIEKELKNTCQKLNKKFKYKIKILLSKNGNYKIFAKRIIQSNNNLKKIILSNKIVNNSNIFLYHKTTNRNFYDNEYIKYKKQGYFDVLFKNQKNQITETSRANIFLEVDGNLITPAKSCGLLEGTYRRFILETKKNVFQKNIYEKDLYNAENIFVTNSVIGIKKVQIEKNL